MSPFSQPVPRSPTWLRSRTPRYSPRLCPRGNQTAKVSGQFTCGIPWVFTFKQKKKLGLMDVHTPKIWYFNIYLKYIYIYISMSFIGVHPHLTMGVILDCLPICNRSYNQSYNKLSSDQWWQPLDLSTSHIRSSHRTVAPETAQFAGNWRGRSQSVRNSILIRNTSGLEAVWKMTHYFKPAKNNKT